MLQEVSAILIICSDMQDLMFSDIIKGMFAGKLHLIVVPFIIERYGYEIFFLVFHIRISDVLT